MEEEDWDKAKKLIAQAVNAITDGEHDQWDHQREPYVSGSSRRWLPSPSSSSQILTLRAFPALK